MPRTPAKPTSTRQSPACWRGGCAIDDRRPADTEPLTARELEVLSLVGQGASNKEIASALFITERTARTHVSNILGKLGLASRTQAALYAVEHKLVTPRA